MIIKEKLTDSKYKNGANQSGSDDTQIPDIFPDVIWP